MAHGPILVRPSPPGIRRRGRRLGPIFHLPTWADFSPKQWWPSILNQRRWAILETTKPARRPNARNPSSLHSFARLFHEAERERESWRLAASRPEVRRRPLASVRRSPEGECAAVEPACSSALRWRLEPTRQWPDKRRRTSGPGPFPERIVFDDNISGHGGEVGPSYC
jgi:hypothetical protein